MGREFLLGDVAYACWTERGHLALFDYGDGIPSEHVPAFIKWLQAGPPKRVWRITRTFEKRPSAVSCGLPPGATPLTDADIEEVDA